MTIGIRLIFILTSEKKLCKVKHIYIKTRLLVRSSVTDTIRQHSPDHKLIRAAEQETLLSFYFTPISFRRKKETL